MFKRSTRHNQSDVRDERIRQKIQNSFTVRKFKKRRKPSYNPSFGPLDMRGRLTGMNNRSRYGSGAKLPSLSFQKFRDKVERVRVKRSSLNVARELVPMTYIEDIFC